MDGGWGTPKGPTPADRLANAVERFLLRGTTGNHENMAKALAEYRGAA